MQAALIAWITIRLWTHFLAYNPNSMRLAIVSNADSTRLARGSNAVSTQRDERAKTHRASSRDVIKTVPQQSLT